MTRLTHVASNGAVISQPLPAGGNIIPHEWYHKIISKAGKPDLTAISILSEIIYWYRPKKSSCNDAVHKFHGDAWQTSYEYFEKRFSYNRERIRRAFVLLEEMGIILRELRVVSKFGQKYGNILFLHLLDKNYLNSFNVKSSKEKKISLPHHKSYVPLPQICGEHYIEEEINRENKEESRSEISSFISEKIDLSKKLSDYYPLTSADSDLLNSKSGREFSLSFTNQLLLKLANKYADHRFRTKESFLNYMSKALSNELMQACRVNDKSFKLVQNLEDKQAYQEEKQVNEYLSEIENTLGDSKETQLKRKIAGRLAPDSAYSILLGTSFDIVGSKLKITNPNLMTLDNNIRTILLNEVRGVYGEHITDIVLEKDIEIAKPSENIWSKLRSSLRLYYGEADDKAWFSKITTQKTTEDSKLLLKAPTPFIRDWIKTHYGNIIEKQLYMLKPDLSEVVYIC